MFYLVINQQLLGYLDLPLLLQRKRDAARLAKFLSLRLLCVDRRKTGRIGLVQTNS